MEKTVQNLFFVYHHAVIQHLETKRVLFTYKEVGIDKVHHIEDYLTLFYVISLLIKESNMCLWKLAMCYVVCIHLTVYK